ncbi:DUF1552 domain-containing protein [Paraliomyxa miuraensis]|uniref:DUF1552 domain-containing protein n=1 Tax=Paraliomyxa miuraensis TaxID=376150 RepID=UPI0022517675|nr:DUF1552 domain-containing protein [Paraliomyxa miuraensis]MCX4247986.1 DUF1552 domain-containing protein [Paraliomyxa miuraensis]
MLKSSLKHSGRRAFLRGAGGAALALPLLEYTHGHAWAADGESALRFLTVFTHGGTISNMNKTTRYDGTGAQHGEDLWRPADPSSEALVLGPIHQPLEAWRDKLVVIEGIDNKSAISQDQYGLGAHGISNGSVLTAQSVTETGGASLAQGPSIDHVLAQRLAARQPVPFDAIHLKVAGHQYGTPYFSGSQQAVSGESSPKAAFNAIFDGVSGGQPDPEIVLRNTKRGSVLDGLMEGYGSFHGRVSARDRHVIEAHLDHLAALEQQLQDPVICNPPQGIEADGGPGDVVGPLMADIIVAAIRCGLTNVANLEIADILTPWTSAGALEGNLGLDFAIGHALHHQARDIGPTGPLSALYDDWMAYTLENRRWRMSLIARLLEGLDDPDFMEGDATVLDNSLLLCTSEFSNGSRHSAWNLPVLLAGGAGGVLPTGRFITYNQHAQGNPQTLQYTSDESIHNLYTSILQAFGESDGHFGNDAAQHQGPLPGLLG